MGDTAEEIDFSSIPINERLVHKSWKARQHAYDSLEKHFKVVEEGNDAEYRKYSADTLKKMVLDANLVAQESGLAAVLSYVQYSTHPTKIRREVAPAIVDKCLASTRQATRQKALDTLMMLIEVDSSGDAVIEDILPGLDHKTPKNVAACVMVLREAIQNFGPKVVSPKPLLKVLPKLFDHKDKNVRSEASLLAVELFKFLGLGVMQPALNDLKPVQVKELTEEFEKVDAAAGKAKPTRFLRSQQHLQQQQAAGSADQEEELEEEASPAADAFDFADAFPLIDKLPKDFYELLTSSKWKERKEVLEAILPLAKSTKLDEKQRYGELVSSLGKRVSSDANIVVVVLAANCIEGIARGLRSEFQQYKSLVLSAMLERCKEKKQNVVDALKLAMDAVFLSFGGFNESIIEDILSAAVHKNPQVRVESMSFLTRSLQTCAKVPASKADVKRIVEYGMKAIDDGDNVVRTAAADLLGTLLKILGERSILAAHFEKLDSNKMTKIKEFCDSAVIKGKKSKASSKENVKPTLPPAAIKSTVTVKADRPKSSAAAKKPAAAFSAATKKKPASSSSSAIASTTSLAPKKESFDILFKFSDESAEELIQTFVDPAPTVSQETEEGGAETAVDKAGLASSNWKTRLSTIQQLLETLKQKPSGEIPSEAVLRVLLKKPGWKENNFQVMTNMILVMQHLARDTSFTAGCVQLAAPGLTDKLGDMKFKRVAGDCLAAFAEATSFGFVLGHVYEPLKKQKAPKVIADGLAWIQQTLIDFGATGIKISEMLDCVKVCLGNTNAAVRNAAVVLLGALRIYVGPEIRGLLNDLNSALLSVIDAEFEKCADKKPVAPTKFSKKSSASSPASSSVTNGSSGVNGALAVDENEDMLDDICPRVDISTSITDTLIEELGHTQWKIRKEALDNMVMILDGANKRIKSNLGNDIIPALKARLGDSNRNLAISALDILATLATSMGRPFEKYAKQIASSISGCLADNKIHVRTAALSALDAFKSKCSLDSFVGTLSQALVADQPLLRKDLLKWLGDSFEASSANLPDLSQFVHPILLCIQDRNVEVRKNAQVVLGFVVQYVGYDSVREKSEELFRGAQLQTIAPIIEAAASSASSKQTVASTSTVNKPQPGTPRKRHTSASTSSSSREEAAAAPVAASKIVAPSSKSSARSKVGAGGTRPSSLNLKKEVVEPVSIDKEAPLLSSDMRAKDIRADRDRGLTKWTFETPRRELIDFLMEQCESNFSSEVHGWMFSTDHYKERDFITAISALLDPLLSPDNCQGLYGIQYTDLKKRYIANADLILKYLTLRFFDTNTSMLIKCLELLENFFGLLEECEYYLCEYEASCFLPFFVNKVGDNKESMRTKIRSIMKQICRIYPASKMFNYVMKGVESKNARTRTECLDELGFLVQRNGLSVCNPPKCFPLIASQIGDRDAGVRNAALGAITQGYLLVGDQIFKYLGRLSDKDKSLLEEKLKRLPAAGSSASSAAAAVAIVSSSYDRPKDISRSQTPSILQQAVVAEAVMESSQESRPASSTPVSSKSTSASGIRKEFSLDLDKLDISKFSSGNSTSSSSSNIAELDRSSAPMSAVPSTAATSAFEHRDAMMDFIITQITDTDIDLSINALKQLEKTLSSNPEKLAVYIDDIINATTMQVRIAFTTADLSSHSTSRLCKHLVNMLVQIFSSSELPKRLSNEPLRQCIQELLNRLLDPSLPSIENGTQLTRALNVLMVRILDNSNRNSVFSVLVEILDQCTRLTRDINQDSLSAQTKYTELVMKCIWKMTKLIPQLIESKSIDIGVLLFDVHNFLIASPPSEWKRRTTQKIIPQADMPLRTVKTILHEIVTVMEDRVFEHLEHIQDLKTSHAVVYLRQMVENEHKKKYGTSYKPSATFEAATSQDIVSAGPGMMATVPEVHASISSTHCSPITKRPLSMPPSIRNEMMQQQLAISGEGCSPTAVAGSGSGSASLNTSAQGSPVSVEQLSNEQVNARLAVIFEKIRDKEQTKQAIADLYNFQKQNPYITGLVDIHLNRTNTYFQGYIRRGLQSLADEDDGSRSSPVKRPMSMMASYRPSSTISAEESIGGPKGVDSYQEKLAKLQRMFNSDGAPQTIDNFKTAAAAAEQGPSSTNSSLPTSSMKSEETSSANKTVADLKERLARMKLNMSSVPSST